MTDKVTITISSDSGQLVADVRAWPGCPPVGAGNDIYECLGRWLHLNRDKVGVEIALDISALEYEMLRRAREVGSR